MGSEDVPGNAGLRDQVMALKWIQQFIANFHGDPDLVTIFGQSGGSIAVASLILSPLANGLLIQESNIRFDFFIILTDSHEFRFESCIWLRQ